MEFIDIFITTIGPILFISVIGYIIGYIKDINVDSVNTIVLYFFIPALVFHSIVTTDFNTTTIFKLSIGVVVFTVFMVFIAYIVFKLSDSSDLSLSVIILSTAFPNTGFIGVPLSEFAFGNIGRTTAVLYLSVQSILIYTLGVYIASYGDENKLIGSFKEIFRLPLIYAVIAAFSLHISGFSPPDNNFLLETINLIGDASIPLMLTVLGIQLVEVNISISHLSSLVKPTILKLIISPILGGFLALILIFENISVAKVFILECAMPTAITPLVLIISYNKNKEDLSSKNMSSIIFTTTVAGIITLTVLVFILKSGFFIFFGR